ncbi:MAG: FkbM family methyltransferase [Flavobacterium sp.]|jgi:FkbM family methyltransferase
MNVKHLRKIFRIVFPLKRSEKNLFEIELRSNYLIKDYKWEYNLYKIILSNEKILYLRNHNYSDYEVFKQIFNFKEYQIVLDILKYNDTKSDKKIIIDAGANVGYTSLFLSFFLNSYSIYAIEPSKENFDMCVRNINDKNIHLFHNALSENTNMKYLLERNFRDKKDWSITTKNDSEGTIKGITVQEIVVANNLAYISLLKIDIEGAERFILNKTNNLEYLKITYMIAVEIHDEFEIRKDIENLLIKSNFFLFNSGELTIGINKKFIGV